MVPVFMLALSGGERWDRKGKSDISKTRNGIHYRDSPIVQDIGQRVSLLPSAWDNRLGEQSVVLLKTGISQRPRQGTPRRESDNGRTMMVQRGERSKVGRKCKEQDPDWTSGLERRRGGSCMRRSVVHSRQWG
jgi:hypothetical protein